MQKLYEEPGDLVPGRLEICGRIGESLSDRNRLRAELLASSALHTERGAGGVMPENGRAVIVRASGFP